jgi:hypothetical protein
VAADTEYRLLILTHSDALLPDLPFCSAPPANTAPAAPPAAPPASPASAARAPPPAPAPATASTQPALAAPALAAGAPVLPGRPVAVCVLTNVRKQMTPAQILEAAVVCGHVPGDYNYQTLRRALTNGCRGTKGPFQVFSCGTANGNTGAWYGLREWPDTTPRATHVKVI